MQETYKKYQEIWYQKWNSYRFEVILTICFLIWTPILITETLRIQDSCSPMVVFSNEHLERCHHREVFCEVGFPDPSGKCPPTIEFPIAASVAAGVGAVAAISGVPIVIAAGISLVVWLVIKKLF